MGSESGSGDKSPHKNLLNDWLKAAFLRLIAEETGLEIKRHDQGALDAKIFSRMKALRIPFPEYYYQLLTSGTQESHQEWKNLVLMLANPESFFFRDKGHFDLLEKHIIPDLIQRNQLTRTIRICSAGCSTGEEPYSLAILCKELIPDLEQWNLMILGLDISSWAIEKAKAGIYRPWSFRNVVSEVKERYFKVSNDEYHIDPEIKKILKFQTCNLVKDSFPMPDSEIREIDLIICRNVFIYFTDTAISRVVEKFYDALQPDGYLLTGHAELYTQNLNKFQAKAFPEGIVYRRLDEQLTISSQSKVQSPHFISEDSELSFEEIQIRDNSIIEPGITQSLHFISEDIELSFEEIQMQENSIIEPRTQDLDNIFSISEQNIDLAHFDSQNSDQDQHLNESYLLQSAESLMQKKAYNLAINQVKKALEINSKNFHACYLMAQLFNHLNNHERAIFFCYKALEIDAFSTDIYYILADIFEKQRSFSDAKKNLKKIVYLKPGAVKAYLKLSHIYQAENDLERMHKMQNAALNILKNLPPKMQIPELDDLSVTQLILQLETSFREN
jgi:chemotaxis protein methyltransferase CheR